MFYFNECMYLYWNKYYLILPYLIVPISLVMTGLISVVETLLVNMLLLGKDNTLRIIIYAILSRIQT